MIPITLTTIITCSQAFALIDKVTKVVGLTTTQKEEIVLEIKKVVKSCPVKIKNDKL